MIILEHRYYGASQPFDNWSVENLKYLTINNALADIANFLNEVQDSIQKRSKNHQRRKVVVVGGSYPGAVSAWMRYQYPHIVDASLSSSGVVEAIEDLWQYDYQVYLATSQYTISDDENGNAVTCGDKLKEIADWFDSIYEDYVAGTKEPFESLYKKNKADDEETELDFLSDST